MPYTEPLVNDTFGNNALTAAVGLAGGEDGIGDLWDEVGKIAEKVGQVAQTVAGIAPQAKKVATGQAVVAIAPKQGPSTIIPVPGQPYGFAVPGDAMKWVVPVGLAALAYLMLRRR